MITYEKVMEEFKEYLEMDEDLEVVKLKHGYYLFIWDEVRKEYFFDTEVIRTDGQLIDALIDEMETFYKIRYGSNVNTKIIDKKQAEFEKFMKKIKKKYGR